MVFPLCDDDDDNDGAVSLALLSTAVVMHVARLYCAVLCRGWKR